MAGRQAKRAEDRADAKADGKTHRMPEHYRWLTLEPPTDQQIEAAEQIGEVADDWSGWQIEANRSVKLGRLSKVMRASATVDAQARSARDDPDAVRDPDDTLRLADAYDLMIGFLQAHVRAWDFGDKDGDPIPYTSEAWEDIDDSLIATAFRAVMNRTSTPPKATAGTPTR